MKRFNTIYATYYTPILSFIKSKMNDKVVAEDITSETFNSVFKNLENFDDTKGNVRSWIYQIAKNKVIDYYRSEGSKESFLSLELLTDEDSGATLKDTVEGGMEADVLHIRTETNEKLDNFMAAKLEENEMRLLKRFCGGIKYKEIAEEEGINVQNVKNIIFNARSKMRKYRSEITNLVL